MISRLAGSLREKWRRLADLRGRVDMVQQALGRIEARQTRDVAAGDLTSAEFKVSSQFGEDGIIEHLIRHVPIGNPYFIEFGVEDYTEANTRFLLRNRNWSGLVLDGSKENIEKIKQDAIYWRHDITAVESFITRENINATIARHGKSGDIGLLSIDIDGNDYWIWEAIDCVSPRIVIVEYNSVFGGEAVVAVPYDAQFVRTAKHHTNLYFGCSIGALKHLADRKGYCLAGSDSAGINAFFVRQDVAGKFQNLSAGAAYVQSRLRQSRGTDGALTYLSHRDSRAAMASMPLIDVKSGASLTVGDIKAD